MDFFLTIPIVPPLLFPVKHTFVLRECRSVVDIVTVNALQLLYRCEVVVVQGENYA